MLRAPLDTLHLLSPPNPNDHMHGYGETVQTTDILHQLDQQRPRLCALDRQGVGSSRPNAVRRSTFRGGPCYRQLLRRRFVRRARLRAVVVGVDVLFFRNRFWEQLMVNIGVVLVFWAFYLRFLKRP